MGAEAIRGALRDVGRDPDAVRARVLQIVRELTQSSAAAWYRLAPIGDDVLPCRWMLAGVDEVFVRPRLEQRIGWPHADPRRPNPRWNRRFVRVRGDELASTALHEQCHQPAGVHELLRMIVIHQGVFVGWIGALRLRGEPGFSRADSRRIGPLAELLADALVRADATERATRASARELVLTPEGRIELASDDGGTLGASEAELRAWARQALRTGAPPVVLAGYRVRWSRLSGSRSVRLLLRLEPLEPLRVHPTYVLTSAQREIAELAARGATVREISVMTGASVATVRAHLREIYARLGLTCRAELALCLAEPAQGDALAA